jgi:hypothetical protein
MTPHWKALLRVLNCPDEYCNRAKENTVANNFRSVKRYVIAACSGRSLFQDENNRDFSLTKRDV